AMSLHVAKFGGTSMGGAEAMRQAASVVRADPLTRFVVVSATSGTTNRLLAAYDAAVSGHGPALEDCLRGIELRHTEIADRLGISDTGRRNLLAMCDELRSNLLGLSSPTDEALDHTLSFGERMSSLLFTE